ncbi:hypothetical protein [Streptomyces sp. TP-A0874]|uniref:hypothetical protein n=1 Tax=Streptomyces sp. TP-A0874 TaxID=549819 RepID=UPI0008539B13|nr:hypothetical protein [Streptomyces sp. TP-A0874]
MAPVRRPARTAAIAVCLVLGLGLLGGGLAGDLLSDGASAATSADRFDAAASLWHSLPVDRIFPPTLRGDGAGPGGADRVWIRIAVAPDSGCADAFDAPLREALSAAGCQRLLRATYLDATSTSVTTVGLVATTAEAAEMAALHDRFEDRGVTRRKDSLPLPYAAKGTAAAEFGAEQRASWSVEVLAKLPAVVYAVTGFADGRKVTEPEPAEEAMAAGATSVAAQAGLGHDAHGIVQQVAGGFRKAAAKAAEEAR